jgi:crossover junction endodeoxyribonuclease RusA
MSITLKQAHELGILPKREKRERAIKAKTLLRGLPVVALMLRLPYPPSDNGYYTVWTNPETGIARKILSKAGREYLKAVSKACTEQGARHVAGRITLEYWLHRDDRRGFDISNTVKAVQDSLTQAGVYRDDMDIDTVIIHRGVVQEKANIEVLLTGEMP